MKPFHDLLFFSIFACIGSTAQAIIDVREGYNSKTTLSHLAIVFEELPLANCDKETQDAIVLADADTKRVKDLLSKVKEAKENADTECIKAKEREKSVTQFVQDAKNKWEAAKNTLNGKRLPLSVQKFIRSSEDALKMAEDKAAEFTSNLKLATTNKTQTDEQFTKSEEKLGEATAAMTEAKKDCEYAEKAAETEKTKKNSDSKSKASLAKAAAVSAEQIINATRKIIEDVLKSSENARYATFIIPRKIRTVDGNADALQAVYETAVAKEETSVKIQKMNESVQMSLQKIEQVVKSINVTLRGIEKEVVRINAMQTPCHIHEIETEMQESECQLYFIINALEEASVDEKVVQSALKNISKENTNANMAFNAQHAQQAEKEAKKYFDQAIRASANAEEQHTLVLSAANAAKIALKNAQIAKQKVTEITCKTNANETNGKIVNKDGAKIPQETIPMKKNSREDMGIGKCKRNGTTNGTISNSAENKVHDSNLTKKVADKAFHNGTNSLSFISLVMFSLGILHKVTMVFL